MNNSEIRTLSPQALWNHFADLNAIPRASKKEEEVIAFMLNFGASLGLESWKDEVGNVFIKKPATKGMEDRQTVVLQSHLDMVHQKNNDTIFDFNTQGIHMYIDGDWVKARGTTLGADNGIGVATIMTLLASTDIAHPAIEALFTIDEETGMTGAKGLQGGQLSGKILLNLDTEEDDELDIGCAGGLDVSATMKYQGETLQDIALIKINLKALRGGHSGIDIHKGLGNANKLMNRLLRSVHTHIPIRIATIDGGSLRNAIPRESTVTLAIAKEDEDVFKNSFNKAAAEIKQEYSSVEPDMVFSLELSSAAKLEVLPIAIQEKLIKGLSAAQHGVYRMSADFKDLVETSNNVARVSVLNGEIQVLCLTRSSVESSKWDLAENLKATFELMGAQVEFSGDYPGWTPNAQSDILDLMKQLYTDLHQQAPKVAACHAGLECGILATNYPGMDMISFGPTIRGAHSPDERVSISSVQKYWQLVQETLKRIPQKV